jgi:Fic family protein
MKWNWQLPDWPRFSWSPSRLGQAEQHFLVHGGIIHGAVSHLDNEGRELLTVEAMSDEAVTSSEIEGEILDRDSVQSSIRRHLGLSTDTRRASPAEEGIAEMMVNLLKNWQAPFDEQTLCSWHQMLMRGRRNLTDAATT